MSSATPIAPHPAPLLHGPAHAGRAQERGADGRGDSPARAAAQHQSLLHFVGQAPWSDAAVLAKVRDLVLPAIERHGPIEAWIIDDTGFPKKGRHSVGVARQYCGQLGKQDNCQVAVTLSLANRTASLPVAYRLYLPQEWADDPARRQKAGVPEAITFQTKPEIALDQIRAAAEAGLPRGAILMDAGYGNDTQLRTDVTALGFPYVAGDPVKHLRLGAGGRTAAAQAVVGPGTAPQADAPRWRAPADLGQGAGAGLAQAAWTEITWREGAADRLTSRFAACGCEPLIATTGWANRARRNGS